MKLAVIGSGNIGKSIGKWASGAGYEVIFTSRNIDHAKEAAGLAGNNARAESIVEGARQADLVLLSVPFAAVKDVLAEIGAVVKGKTVIDATNAVNTEYTGLTLGFTTSAAEETQKLAPGAKVVKAFNTVFASVYASGNPEINGKTVTVFYAGDDNESKAKVSELITKMGFDPLDCGSLKSARMLEPLALLNITLGYNLGHGTDIGFTVLRK